VLAYDSKDAPKDLRHYADYEVEMMMQGERKACRVPPRSDKTPQARAQAHGRLHQYPAKL
jgi:hypothetical protein